MKVRESIIQEIVIPVDDHGTLLTIKNLKYRYSPNKIRIDSLDLAYRPNYHENMIIPELKRAVIKSVKELNLKISENINMNMLNSKIAAIAGDEIYRRHGRIEFISAESYHW